MPSRGFPLPSECCYCDETSDQQRNLSLCRERPRAPAATLEDRQKILRELTRTPVWGTLAVSHPVRLSTSCAGVSPVMAAEEFLPPGKLRIVPAAQLTRGRVRRGHQLAARTDFHVCNATSCPVPSSGRGKRGLHKLPRVSTPTPRVQSTNDRFRGGAIDGAFPFRVGVAHMC